MHGRYAHQSMRKPDTEVGLIAEYKRKVIEKVTPPPGGPVTRFTIFVEHLKAIQQLLFLCKQPSQVLAIKP